MTAQQDAVVARIVRAIPGAQIRWRYAVVLDGLAVALPRGDVARLRRVKGVAEVWPSAGYAVRLDRTPQLIHAPQVWGPLLATAGQGMKIGIIDDGIDQTHPFFDPTGYTYPPGFPKGDTRYTTPKVIVARAFAPPGTTYPYATLPFDPKESEHGTHVSGIAAGNYGTSARGIRVSGIAPKAYLGNYKALSVPTPDFGINGNAPELVAAIEAAVRDGMNVINLSLGEPDIDLRRDVVAQALDGAARAGVVPVVAAGNEYTDFGRGSISSPANAPLAIAVAASTGGHGAPQPDRIASFSSGGPTPYGLLFKPDVTAPGSGVLSSVPARTGLWGEESGTSMAAPHVAGAAAVLLQRHPTWTVEQVKSALVVTGVPVKSGGREVPSTREGGGRIDLLAADTPGLFAQPASFSFGLVRPGHGLSAVTTLTDAGTPGAWSVSVQLQGAPRGVAVTSTPQATVPGDAHVRLRVGRTAPEQDVTGFIVLTPPDGTAPRRLPFWFRVERPKLQLDRALPLGRVGDHVGTTLGAPSRVNSYRYPELNVQSYGLPTRLAGPERVYRVRIVGAPSNFGAAVTGHAPGVTVQPRIVIGTDENRLGGYMALPVDLNPYRATYGLPRPIVGLTRPHSGTYSVIFDSTRRARRGSFTFRVWLNDTSPPRVRVLSTTGALRLSVTDRGSGVDPLSLHASIDGHARAVSYANGVARVSLARLSSGTHALVFVAADRQETKNTENVGPVDPNTRVLRTTVTVP